jgi:hypothetical protein
LADQADRKLPLKQIEHAIEKPDDPRLPASIKELVRGTDVMPADWTQQERAHAFWNLIVDLVEGFDQGHGSKRQAALRIALMINKTRHDDPEPQLLRRRIEHARLNGVFGNPRRVGKDQAAQYWTDGVVDLAIRLDRRVGELGRNPDGWQDYRVGRAGAVRVLQASTRSPDITPLVGSAPFYIDRMINTYTMRGRCVGKRTTEMWITSWVDGLDHYDVRVWSHVGGEPVVGVRAWLNCRVGSLRSVASLNRLQILEYPVFFPEPLRKGQDHHFAIEVEHLITDDDDTPLVELEVTCQGIAALERTDDGWPTRGLSMRLQFETGAYPAAAWWFAKTSDFKRFDRPPDGDPHRLTWSPHGYLEHSFTASCEPNQRYGLGWAWA